MGHRQEHHLQAALSASQAAAVGGKVAQIYIPTPDTIQSSIQYDKLYPLTFPQPATYIRFSSTVEDCCGCPYDMDDDDDLFLKSLNKRDASTMCSEDQFEEVMNFYEETAQAKQPYAAVDNPPVLTYEEIEDAFDESFDAPAKVFSREIYEHWKSRRLKSGNRPLLVNLKVMVHLPSPVSIKLTYPSSRLVRRLMIPIRTYVSEGGKSVKCARPAAEMLIALRSSKSFGRSSRKHARSWP